MEKILLEAVLGNISGGEYARWQRGTALTFRRVQRSGGNPQQEPTLAPLLPAPCLALAPVLSLGGQDRNGEA